MPTTNHTINIEQSKFNPSSLDVNPNDTITFQLSNRTALATVSCLFVTFAVDTRTSPQHTVVANASGTYPIRANAVGDGTGTMSGTINVGSGDDDDDDQGEDENG